jgi:hypothetical protein
MPRCETETLDISFEGICSEADLPLGEGTSVEIVLSDDTASEGKRPAAMVLDGPGCARRAEQLSLLLETNGCGTAQLRDDGTIRKPHE